MFLQEEYSEDDKIGKLECGHGYHTDCIKQWLMLKNLCPIFFFVSKFDLFCNPHNVIVVK